MGHPEHEHCITTIGSVEINITSLRPWGCDRPMNRCAGHFLDLGRCEVITTVSVCPIMIPNYVTGWFSDSDYEQRKFTLSSAIHILMSVSTRKKTLMTSYTNNEFTAIEYGCDDI